MNNRRYFVNLETGGRMIVDAQMGPSKQAHFDEIVGDAGFEEVSGERYRKLQHLGRIGEEAVVQGQGES